MPPLILIGPLSLSLTDTSSQSQDTPTIPCFGGGLQACIGECEQEYNSCLLSEGVTGWVCLLFGPEKRPHRNPTCGSFGSDVCLDNKFWCEFGCKSACVGPWPPTITPPPVDIHH